MPAAKKPYKIGTYQLGFQWVDLWVDPTSDNGEFSWFSKKQQNCRVMLGIASSDYSVVLGTLLHEIVESTCCDLKVRFQKTGLFSDSTDQYHFMMDHNDFTELMARAGHFVRMSQLDLMKAHNRLHGKR